jgi:hypothetical protein
MTTQEINSKLQIVNIKGKRFSSPLGYYEITKGFALYVPELGYLAFQDCPDCPYSPSRKALKEILEAGGMVHYDTIIWLKEMA